jgi:hypothetical protein
MLNINLEIRPWLRKLTTKTNAYLKSRANMSMAIIEKERFEHVDQRDLHISA